jgi:hypothetical protein
VSQRNDGHATTTQLSVVIAPLAVLDHDLSERSSATWFEPRAKSYVGK